MASPSTSTSTSTPSQKMITLTSSDGLGVFELSEKAAFQCQTLKAAYGSCDDDDNGLAPKIKVNNDNNKHMTNIKLDPTRAFLTAETLRRVVEYCDKHADDKTDVHTFDQQHKQWDQDFIKVLDRNQLFDILLAADYLEIKSLVSLSAQGVADLMKDMSVEEVREIFGIVNDYTPEEEEALRIENQWAFVGIE